MKYSAGSYESSDCIITVYASEETHITIESIVFEQFGEQIKTVILDTLKECGVEQVTVQCFDKGALDYTIKARLLTALQRMGAIS